jgi:hypothetical protein
LHAEDVAGGAGVGEDAGVGDAKALEVVGQKGRGRVLQGEVEVDGVETSAVEEVVALRRDRLVQVGARPVDGDQGEVVVRLDLDVELGPVRDRRARRRIGERPAQLAESSVRPMISRCRSENG